MGYEVFQQQFPVGSMLTWRVRSSDNSPHVVIIKFLVFMLPEGNYGLCISPDSQIPLSIEVKGDSFTYHGHCIWIPGSSVRLMHMSEALRLCKITEVNAADFTLYFYELVPEYLEITI